MDSLTPQERRLRGQAAAYARWAQHDPKQHGVIMRASWRSGFERKAQEQANARGEVLTPDELARRAESLFKSHMKRLALRSAKARRERAAGGAA